MELTAIRETDSCHDSNQRLAIALGPRFTVAPVAGASSLRYVGLIGGETKYLNKAEFSVDKP
jgi:hypothetical protein